MNTESNRAEGDVNFTPQRQQWLNKQISQDTQSIIQKDADLFFHQALSSPCLNVLKSAQGSWLTDHQNRRILDFHGNSLHQLGYGHPHVLERVQKCMGELPFSPRRYTNSYAIELAQALIDIAPIEDAKVLFSPNGATAMSMALKLARWNTGRYKTISMRDSFHGATLDAISVGGEEIFHRGLGPLLPGAMHIEAFEPAHCAKNCSGKCQLTCLDDMDDLFKAHADVAAVVVETIRCTDVQIPPASYFQRIRNLCDQYGALMILDEIPIALGRTGSWFAIDSYQVQPDMVVIGKGLGGGVLPLAALIGSKKLDTAAEVSMGHFTHEKNPVLCAAGLATLEVLQNEKLNERCRKLGSDVLLELQSWISDFPFLKEARGAGLLIGVEMCEAYGLTPEELSEMVLYESLSRGLSFKVGKGRVLVLSPPLNISEEDIQQALDILRDTFEDLHFRLNAS